MSIEATSPFDVFISYNEADRDIVRGELLSRLEAAGLRVCVDFRDFNPEVPINKQIQRAVKDSRYTVIVLSPAYLSVDWPQLQSVAGRRINAAARQGQVIPVLVEDCNAPSTLAQLTYVNYADPTNRPYAWTQLLTALSSPRFQEAQVEQGRAQWRLMYPYPMPPNFTGRVTERRILTQWLEADQDHPVLIIRAMGGYGKSALAWHWLMHDVDERRWPRVVWWSFYEVDAGWDRFLADTLSYLGVNTRGLGPGPQVEALLDQLHEPGTLLVLDGFERVLRAFWGLEAVYQGDTRKAVNQGLLAGRNGAAPPAVRDREAPLRDEKRSIATDPGNEAVSPYADDFLRALATLPDIQGKVLLTTRLSPGALEAESGSLLIGCREEELTSLNPADAVNFFRAQGIRGSHTAIDAVCAPYGYHPLSLRLLTGLLVSDPERPGDVVLARRMGISGDLTQRRTHVLTAAHADLTPVRRNLLGRVACMRGPVSYETLLALSKIHLPGFWDRMLGRSPQPVLNGAHSNLEKDLRDLTTRGLLMHERRTGRYDLHPIVRQFVYERLTPTERVNDHLRLRDHFDAVETPTRIRGLDDLVPLVDLYHHTIRSGQYDTAYGLFYERLGPVNYNQVGAYHLRSELLLALFPDGVTHPPRLTSERAQGWTLSALANSLAITSQPHLAIPLFERDAALCEKHDDKANLAITLGNLATQQLTVGRLKAAEVSLRRSLALSQTIPDGRQESAARQELGRLLAYRGVWNTAEQELTAALATAERVHDVQGQALTWVYRALVGLLRARQATGDAATSEAHAANALAAAQQAMVLVRQRAQQYHTVERDTVRSHWLLGAAMRLTHQPDQAQQHLGEALAHCRRINMADQEADILIELGRLARADGDIEQAANLAERGRKSAVRSGYALQAADAYLLLAQLAQARGDRATALAHVREARRLATCDGLPDHTYKVTHDQAWALLVNLGEGS